MKKKLAVPMLMLLFTAMLLASFPAYATFSASPETGATAAPVSTGSLIISSAYVAPEGFNPHKVFTFVVKDSLGQVVASPTITGQGSVTVTGLTIGESYTVTEEYPCEKGYAA